MDGFPREKINATANLKDMIISQMQATFGPVNECENSDNTYTKFDVIIQKFNSVFVARGIVYLKPAKGVALNDHRRWRLLREARSEDGVMNAMENLWNQMQAMDTKDPAMKEMRVGDVYEFR
ncbi:hypothetical protein CC86DRAFT_399669 [Ophiobolus disseminans]|uniref:Uncharacterized protein n=1 Tax=Ophiobolus disseminans TaxID=1469910 RepID=A0A6A7AI76_9PLEO|nr:hypothetical protein CC86DRAFT_399669 [Ophiobolus disseminans]